MHNQKWDLRNIRALCKVLGNPQKSFESIHIAGTNGKGSTAFYLANILQAHKLSTGLFTSPHLVTVRERFMINGKMISQRELNSLLLQIEKNAEAINIKPSYFESLTAAAFLWFKKKRVQVAVLEAGLGGRLDSTKVANGRIAAITSIGLDHTELLGNTKEDILKEKLGILEKGTLILGNLPRELLAKCPPHIKAKKISPELQVGNFGKVYIKNAELSFAIAKEFLGKNFSEKLSRKTLKETAWPGRMQMLFENKKLKVILDGAHNPDAAKILAKCLREKKFPQFPCIFASLDDKDTYGVLKALKPHISVCYATQVEDPRTRSTGEICDICKSLKINAMPLRGSIKNCISKLENPVLITGSLYLVGEAMHNLQPQFFAFRNAHLL